MKRSRYLMISPLRYRDSAKRTVQMVYSSRTAKLVAVADDIAAKLADDDLTDIGAADLAQLVSIKAVVPQDENELTSVLTELRAGSNDPGTRGFTIMPTSYCNMACDYCGQEHFKSAVDRAKMERIAARVEAAFADPATKEVSVSWFGGEPMLALRVVQELSERFLAAAAAHDKRYTARMTTNGSLLTARTLDILHRQCRLAALEITIDGPQAVHDSRRIKRNGIGAFHRTVAALGKALREDAVPGMAIGIRVNVDHENEGTVGDLIFDLACLGFGSPQVQLHLMPVHSWGNDVSAVELEALRFAGREAEWLALASSLGIGVPAIPNVLKKTTCRATSIFGEIVDNAERIYSCSEHPLVPKVRQSGVLAMVGDLPGATPRPAGAFDDWYDQVDDGKQMCGRCPLLPICGGACPKLWREGHMPCPSMKFNWHDRVDMTAKRMGYEPVQEV